MPRTGREIVDDMCYHVINRGNCRMKIFYEDEDYQEFIELIEKYTKEINVRLMSYCIMPNHFHFVLRPKVGKDMSEWMRRVLTAQVRNYHKRHLTNGHLWQGRYKSFPIQKNEYLETVLRYVERNALRANLVKKAEDWPWSSLYIRLNKKGDFLTIPPIELGKNWKTWVNKAITEDELVAIRNSVNRCSPYGSKHWIAKKVKELGLESTVAPRGRPKKI